MHKSAEAFRTISEVATEIDVPKHVLRFWEGKFSQLKPMKRGGGRRYYRPGDVDLLKGIRQLLYGNGYTIKGVQKLLKEQGIDYVKSCWQDDPAGALLDAAKIPDLAQETARRAADPANKRRIDEKAAEPDETGRPPKEAQQPALQLTKEQEKTLKAALKELEACKKIIEELRE